MCYHEKCRMQILCNSHFPSTIKWLAVWLEYKTWSKWIERVQQWEKTPALHRFSIKKPLNALDVYFFLCQEALGCIRIVFSMVYVDDERWELASDDCSGRKIKPSPPTFNIHRSIIYLHRSLNCSFQTREESAYA